jgi:hypothetical protein
MLLLAPAVSCDRDAGSALKGQQNTTLTFYGKIVDQDGRPLGGAQLEYRAEAYPKNWTFDTRGRDNEAWSVAVVSDDAGRFQLPIAGCKLIRMKAELKGYRHLCDEDTSTGSIDNRFYHLISWSDLCYKTDVDHPAIYVFVKDGVKEVTVLPSRGGWNSGNGTHWRPNVPAWPKKPSLPDVDQRGARPRVNAKVPLVIKVVDPDGSPMPDVLVWLYVERYRSLEEMARDHRDKTSRTEVRRAETVTGPDGLAVIDLEAFRIDHVGAAVQGIEWSEGPFMLNRPIRDDFYARGLMDRSGNVIYRCNADNPMVLVMYPKDASEVHVLPCAGGYELRDGKWVPVQPQWIEGARGAIVYSPPASTQQSIQEAEEDR